MEEKEYDFIIIGSGMGGLYCAYVLADFGYSVCVLEKNHQTGGSLQVFSRNKAIFDTGVHYIGSLDPDQNLGMFFKYAGIYDKVEWKKMDTVFDKVSFSGDPKEYPIAQGDSNFIDELSQYFPDNRDDIEAYIDKLKTTCENFPLLSLEYEDHNYHSEEFAKENVQDVINGITDNPKLQKVLAGVELLYGGRADSTPFYVHALVVYGYIQSAYKCVNGGTQIAKALVKQIRSKGGEIVKRAKVVQLKMTDGKVVAAITEDGKTFTANNFISNAHPKNTFDLIDDPITRKPYFKRIKKLENSVSSFTIHIKLKPNSFPYLNHNVYHLRVDDPWQAANYTNDQWPANMFICTPAKSQNQEFADVISVMSYMRFSEVEQWAHTTNTVVESNDRGPAYKAWCKAKAGKMVDALSERFPNIKECIEDIHTSSPLTYRDYIGNDDGSMYGVLKDNHLPIKTFIPPSTKIPNLYLSGQNTNLHGILGVTISAIATCTQFVDRRELIDRIKAS